MNIFDYAMKMEKDGENYYRELSKKVKNKGLKKIFNMLAEDEVKHYNTFKDMKEDVDSEMSDTKILNDSKNIFEKMKDEGDNFDFEDEHKNQYKKALEIEERSINFYNEKSKEVESEFQKNMFKKIAEEERKHYNLVYNIVEFVSRPDQWLDDAEWYHLEEY